MIWIIISRYTIPPLSRLTSDEYEKEGFMDHDCLSGNTVHLYDVEISVQLNMTDISSFEISEDILRNQKIMIRLDSFSNLRLIYLAPFALY